MNPGIGFWTEQEIRDRVSVSTLVFGQFMPLCERSLLELTKRGIRKIELLESPMQCDLSSAGSMKVMGDIFNACGIEVAAYHAHRTEFHDIEDEQARVERVDTCRRQIDSLAELGGTVWASHAYKHNPLIVKSYEELLRHVEGTNIVVAFENFVKEGCSVGKRVALLDVLEHKNAGMILDIGHVRNKDGGNSMTVPGGPTEVIRLCGRHLKHLHLHGFKNGIDHHPPMVEGDTIQWAELFLNLHKIDYTGLINFEPYGSPRDGSDQTKTLATVTRALEHAARFPREIVEQLSRGNEGNGS